jgi:hypothetical protein
MKPTKLLRLTVATAYLAAIFAPLTARAATTAYPSDTDLTVAGVTLKVAAGSQQDGLTVTSTNFTVTLAAGQTFIVRYPGPGPKALENNALQSACNVTPDGHNQLTLNGPVTATVTPIDQACATANASTNQTPKLTLSGPNAGASYKAGDKVQLFWSYSGNGVGGVKFSLSSDSGQTYPTVITENTINNGLYEWTVPLVTTTAKARLRIDGIDQGRVTAMDVSDYDFAIAGTDPPPAPPSITVTQYDYEVDEEIRTAATIGVDKGLVAAPSKQICHPDSRIKAKGMDTVYYCGADGKRYVFPNRKTHDTWYDNFNGVIELELADIQKIPLGGNVTYRPGAKLVKIQTSPEVFAIGANGELRYVSEKAAKRLYGENWNTKVDDLGDAFVTNYHVGDAIME